MVPGTKIRLPDTGLEDSGNDCAAFNDDDSGNVRSSVCVNACLGMCVCANV